VPVVRRTDLAAHLRRPAAGRLPALRQHPRPRRQRRARPARGRRPPAPALDAPAARARHPRWHRVGDHRHLLAPLRRRRHRLPVAGVPAVQPLQGLSLADLQPHRQPLVARPGPRRRPADPPQGPPQRPLRPHQVPPLPGRHRRRHLRRGRVHLGGPRRRQGRHQRLHRPPARPLDRAVQRPRRRRAQLHRRPLARAREDVWSAFKQPGKPPRRAASRPAQPNHWWAMQRSLWLSCVVFVAAWWFLSGPRSRPIRPHPRLRTARHRLRRALQQGDQDRQRGHPHRHRVTFSAGPLENSWAYAEIMLINLATEEATGIGAEVEWYSGYDGGESWSEGSKTTTITVGGISGGKYLLQIHPQRDGTNLPTPSSTSASRSRPTRSPASPAARPTTTSASTRTSTCTRYSRPRRQLSSCSSRCSAWLLGWLFEKPPLAEQRLLLTPRGSPTDVPRHLLALRRPRPSLLLLLDGASGAYAHHHTRPRQGRARPRRRHRPRWRRRVHLATAAAIKEESDHASCTPPPSAAVPLGDMLDQITVAALFAAARHGPVRPRLVHRRQASPRLASARRSRRTRTPPSASSSARVIIGISIIIAAAVSG
jgi:hypothetical protein